MSTQANVHTITQTAGADLTAAAAQYTILKNSGAANTVVQATAGADKIVGVLQNRPVNATAASVAISGKVKVVASTGIAVGANITATTGGKAIATTTPGHHVLGVCVAGCSNADELIEVLIQNTRVPA